MNKRNFIKRYVPKSKDWAVPAVAGLTTLAFLYGTFEGKTVDVPAQAVGAALTTGSTGTTVMSPIISVGDTTVELVYEARYATLSPEVEQSPGKAIPNPFSVTLRST